MNLALTRFERRWAHAAFDTIFPGADRGSLPLGITDMDLDGYLDETLADVPFEPSIGLRLAFWVIALSPLFVLGKWRTIASLGLADRERVILTLAASPLYALRSTVIALKAIGAILYCGDLRVRPLILGRRSAPEGGVVPLRLHADAPPKTFSSPGAKHEPHARIA
jgi:hypothetical protein